MPHTSRPCDPPYGSRLREILGDSWSHWSICQSRSHWMTPVDRIELRPGNPRFFQEIQMQGDPFNILIGTSTNDRQKSSRARAMSRPSTKPKPGNRRFFTKIIRIRPKLTSYEIGSDRSTKNRQKSFAHVLSNARPGNRRVTVSNEPKLSTYTKNIHYPEVLEPPTSPIKFAKLKIKRQSARKGLNLGHAGGAMCKV